VQTKIFRHTIALALLILYACTAVTAQNKITISLDSAMNMALEKNHLLNVRKLQVEEKKQKVNEDRIKYLPAIVAGGQFQYNTDLPAITMEQGRFGTLPLGTLLIPLPAKDEVFDMGEHRTYQAGVTLYQPVTQIGKINAGVGVSKSEYRIAQAEKLKAEFQLKQAVEKLYFGMLITMKQIEESEIKVEMAKAKLANVQGALSAGKTTESGLYGLAASEADEEQTLLRLRIQYEDYASDLKQAAGIDPAADVVLQPVNNLKTLEALPAIDSLKTSATTGNNDLQVASLLKVKADNAIRASKFSYLPDLGLLGGYTYQEGSSIYPKNNLFVGASFKWNMQDLLTTRAVQLQRLSAGKQAEENLANTREQLDRDIAKAVRRLKQAQELIKVARKVVDYRKADLKIQSDRRSSGLNLEADLLTAMAALAKSESDYFAAQLNYRMAVSDLKILTGKY